MDDNERLLPSIIDTVRRAAGEVIKVYGEADLGIEVKGDDSPLTKADRISHSIITEGVEGLLPGALCISEEGKELSYEKRKNSETVWLIDPLDGTKEFIKRNGEFTINVALVKKGKPVLGIISIPVRGSIYVGISGRGVFVLEGDEDVSDMRKIERGDHSRMYPVAALSRSHLSEDTKTIVESMGAEVINAGSALKFVLVAEGKADIYPRLGPTWEWDTAAGQAIAEAAGAVVCGLDGIPLEYNKPVLKHDGFMVSSPGYREVLLEKIKELKGDAAGI